MMMRRMHSICVISVLLLRLNLNSAESVIDALLELRKGIQTDNSGQALVSWDSKSLSSEGCPNNWFGITCSNGHVTSIVLTDLNLAGSFNFAAISGLSMLQNISVSSNKFSGTITEDIASLKSLASLDLSHNLFNGPIPNGFASMKPLEYLDLHSNGFTGDVMSLLSQLGALNYVDLSCNNFSGSLDLGLGHPEFISSVQYLNISNNNLTEELFPHDGIPYFDNLEVFDASDNSFVGNVPSFSLAVSLRVIKLSNNQLSGSLPRGLLQESSMILSKLDLSHNQLEGPVESITSLNLRSLNLSSNKLSGPLPLRIGHCAIVDLSNNMFSGNVSRIQGWGNYVELLDLSSNGLTGSLPSQTTQFTRLTSLKISNNSLEGDLPSILATYPEIESIDLSLNKLSGLLLSSLFNSSKLTDINLSFNSFSGTIPTSNNEVSDGLTSLNLSHNSLTGPLPPELGRYRNMMYLDLSNNLLEGAIPNDLPQTIVVFNVSYNNFSGVVPQSLQKFPSSSFYPGNSLLVIPNEGLSPESSNSFTNLKDHGYRMKSVIRAALISGLVAAVLVIAVITLLIYCRLHQNSGKWTSKSGNRGSTHLGIESDKKSKDCEISEAKKTTEDITSPSASKIQHQSENPNTLSVCSPDKMAGDLHLFDNSLKFTAEELSAAPAEAVGMSCHGTLYKAVLSTSGHVLAVKLLKEGIAKGKKDFSREARKLGSIRHPCLNTLQGFYWGPKEHEKLLISKFIDAPCLALYLHGTDPRTLPPLSLDQRLKTALDTARCLEYLHNESAIPHGNLKSTNILIEIPNTSIFLTDYSLHRLLTTSGTTEQVLNSSALGYRPPEFASTSKPCPSLKSDVYAFGVIMLELLTGKCSSDIVPGKSEVVDLSEWVSLMAEENRAFECFDSYVLSNESSESVVKCLESMLHVALKCVLPASERPDMKMVLEDLCSIVL